MKLAYFVGLACLAQAAAHAQTLVRTYSVPFSDSDSAAGTGAANAFAGRFDYPLADVDEGTFVEVIGVGFSMNGTQRLEADYSNPGASPIVVGSAFVEPDHYGVIGDPAGCAIGVDECGFGCGSGGASVTVPAGSTVTRVEVDLDVEVNVSAGPGSFAWPCILTYDSLDAGVSARITSSATSEVRAETTIEGFTAVTAELALNPGVGAVCLGAPNSLGLRATAEYFGSTVAGTSSAALRVTRLPFDVATFCIITDAFSSSPLGVGPLPGLCLRGSRTYQRIQFATDAGSFGESVFDLNLAGFAPGESFAIQVGYRDSTPGGSGVSNMLVGTAQ